MHLVDGLLQQMQQRTDAHHQKGDHTGPQHQLGIVHDLRQPGDDDTGTQRDQGGDDAADGQHGAIVLGTVDEVGQLVFADGIQGNAGRLQQADAGKQGKGSEGRRLPQTQGDVAQVQQGVGNFADGGAADDAAPVGPLGAEGRGQNIGGLHQGGVDVNKAAGKAQTGQKGLHDGSRAGQQGGCPQSQGKDGPAFVVLQSVIHKLT